LERLHETSGPTSLLFSPQSKESEEKLPIYKVIPYDGEFDFATKLLLKKKRIICGKINP
jgi:hypothetical protein